MTTTLTDLKQKIIERTDPNDLLEQLALTTEDLVNAFEDKIEERFYQLAADFEDEEDET